MLSGHTRLRVEFDQQDHVRRALAEGRLDRVVDLTVRVHSAARIHRRPVELTTRAPRASGARRIADQSAFGVHALLQMELVVGAVLEICEVFVVQVEDREGHSQVFTLRHGQLPFVSCSVAFGFVRFCSILSR